MDEWAVYGSASSVWPTTKRGPSAFRKALVKSKLLCGLGVLYFTLFAFHCTVLDLLVHLLYNLPVCFVGMRAFEDRARRASAYTPRAYDKSWAAGGWPEGSGGDSGYFNGSGEIPMWYEDLQKYQMAAAAQPQQMQQSETYSPPTGLVKAEPGLVASDEDFFANQAIVTSVS